MAHPEREPDPRLITATGSPIGIESSARVDETRANIFASASAHPFLSQPQQPDEIGRLGRFRILGELGRGGMGVVYRADDPHLNRQVALKVMLPEYVADPDAKSRFLREGRAAAAVEHDHVIPVFDVGEDNGTVFLAMPLLRGQTLGAALKANPRPSLAEVLRIGREIAEGLAAAHAAGLVHRDIKPANVWLEGERRRARILDFGLARTDAEVEAVGGTTLMGSFDATRTGTILGTPAYMSPEQAKGERAGPAADVFSLGIVLYQMASGRLPFASASVRDVLDAIVSAPPPTLAEVAPDAPAALVALIESLMAKRPEDRPNAAATAAELRQLELAISAGLRPIPLDPIPGPVGATESWAAFEPPDAVPAAPRPRRSSWRPTIAWSALGLAVLAAAVAAAFVLRGRGVGTGTLHVDAENATMEIVIRKDGREVRGRTTERDFVLPAGEYTVEPVPWKAGLRVRPDRVRIGAGEEAVVSIWTKTVVPPGPGAAPPPRPPTREVPFAEPPPPGEKPYSIVRAGAEVQVYRSLPTAVAESEPGDIIEVRGNGALPFQMLMLDGKDVTIRAAAGSRPCFFPDVSVLPPSPNIGGGDYLIVGTKSKLAIEGCEFHSLDRQGMTFIDCDVQFTRCALVQGHGTDNRNLLSATGGRIRFTDCYLERIHSYNGIGFGPNTQIELDNCLLMNLSWMGTFVHLGFPGGQSLKLQRCTITGWPTIAISLHGDPKSWTLPIALTVHGNIFSEGCTVLGIAADLSDTAERARVRGLVKWDGRDNTYTTRGMIHSFQGFLHFEGKPDDPPIRSLKQWATFFGQDKNEPGSQVFHHVRIAIDVLDNPAGAGEPVNRLRQVQKWSERLIPAGVGPDLELLGANTGYLRAVFGTDAVPPERMRPEAPAAGPFVVVRESKVVHAFPSLAEAVTAAQDGDAIEIRTDMRTPGIALPPNQGTGKRLTIRASPGYVPIVDRIASPDPWTVEGLRISFGIEGGIVRIANCYFNPALSSATPSIALTAPQSTGVVEVVNCLVTGETGFTLAPGQRARVANCVLSSIRFELPGPPGASTLELSRSVCWLANSIHPSVSAGGATEDRLLEVSANSCIFEAQMMLSAPGGRIQFRWSGDNNIYRANPGACWMWPLRVPDETIIGLSQWRAAWGSDANSTMQLPIRFDPNAWKLMPNEKKIDVSTDITRIPAVRAGVAPQPSKKK